MTEIVLPNDYKELAMSPEGIEMEMPFYIGKSTESLWCLPLEPIVSVSLPIIIARNSIAKANGIGTVKERWATDDFKITVSGVFINYENEDEFPVKDVETLKGLCTYPNSLHVSCILFRALGISEMAIASVSFPHTEGIFAQEFVIEGWSDNYFNLLEG